MTGRRSSRVSPLSPRRLAGRLRLRLLQLGPDTRLDSPALRAAPAPVRQHLVGRADALRAGFADAIAAPDRPTLVDELDTTPPDLRPFRYEGAAMGCALLDLLPLPGRHRWAELHALRGGSWTRFLAIGRGWAYASLGRTPQLATLPTDPAIPGAAAEGAGFHDTVFGHFPRPALTGPPPIATGYDIGSGRALWFLLAADPDQVAAAIATVSPARQTPVWNGVGFAATLAGGVPDPVLRRLRRLAPPALADGARAAAHLLATTPVHVAGAHDRHALLTGPPHAPLPHPVGTR